MEIFRYTRNGISYDINADHAKWVCEQALNNDRVPFDITPFVRSADYIVDCRGRVLKNRYGDQHPDAHRLMHDLQTYEILKNDIHNYLKDTEDASNL